MKTYKELIEVFNTTYDFKKIKGNYEFLVGEDKFIVMFDNKEVDYQGDDIYVTEMSFTKNNSLSQSSTKEVFQVFGTILEILKKEIKSIDVLFFTSLKSDKSRMKVYDKFAKALEKSKIVTSYETFEEKSGKLYFLYTN
jgi:hypothetical protein